MKSAALLILALHSSPAAGLQQLPQLHRQAMQKLEQSDVRGALADFRALLQQSGRKEFHYYLGHCKLKLGEYEDAVDHFRQAALLQKNSWQLELGLGRALFHLDQLKEAKEHLTAAQQLNPEAVEAPYHLGLIQVRQGQFESALGSFRAVAQSDPYHLGAAYNLGICHARLGQAEKAHRWMQRHAQLSAKLDQIESLRKAASFPSSTADNWISLGNAYLEIEDYPRANQAFVKAMQLSAASQLHYYLGFTADKMGKLEEAADHYRRFLQEQPDHAPALFNLAQTLKKAGKPELAAEAFQKASEKKPDDPWLRVPLLEILVEGQQWGQVLQAADRLVRDFPRFAHGHYLRALSLWRLGRLQEALSGVRQALALDADQAENHRLAAQILQALGRPQEARRELEAARKREQ